MWNATILHEIHLHSRVVPTILSSLRLSTCYWLLLFLVLSACDGQHKQAKVTQQGTTAFQPRSFSLARLDGTQSFLDSLRALPRVDTLLLRQFFAKVDSRYIPGKAYDAYTTFHRYTTLTIGERHAEVIAEIMDINTVYAILHLILFDEQNQCVATVPLALHYDEAGGSENWSSIQKTRTSFLQRQEKSDFVYKSPMEGDPVGRDTVLIYLSIELKNSRVEKSRVDSTYTATKH
ncbi:hypothetical protein [Hymenobacter tenuis]